MMSPHTHTITISSAGLSVLAELEETRDRWWLFSFLFNLLSGLIIAGTLLLTMVAIDWWLQLERPTLLISFTAWFGTALGLMLAAFVLAIMQQRTLAAAARRLEMSFPELGSDLINVVEFAEGEDNEDAFHQAAVQDVATRLSGFPISVAAYGFSWFSRWRLAMQTGTDVCGLCSILLLQLSIAILLYFFVPNWSASVNRLLTPARLSKQVELMSCHKRSAKRSIPPRTKCANPVWWSTLT